MGVPLRTDGGGPAPAATPETAAVTARGDGPSRAVEAAGLRIPITFKVLGTLVLLALVSAGLLSSTLISYFTADKTNYVVDAGNKLALSTSASLDLLFDMYRRQLLGVAEIFDRDEEPGDGLSAYMRNSPQCLFLGVYNRAGEQVLSVHRRSRIQAAELDVDGYVADRGALAELPAQGTDDIVVRNTSASGELLSFSVTMPFRSVSYEQELVLYAEYLADPILRLVHKSAGLDVYVLDDRGQLVAHADPELMAARRRPPDTAYLDALLERARQAGGTTERFAKSDGVGVLASSLVGEVGGLVVTVERASADAFEAAREVTQQSIKAAVGIAAVAVVLSLFVSRALTGRLLDLRAAAQRLEKGDFELRLRTRANDELGDLARSINLAAVGLKERAQLSETIKQEQTARSKLERYHSPAVIERIIKSGAEADALDVHKLDVSVAFTDLVGFTSMSESMEPDRLCAVLNQFFTEMTECIFDHDGTLDKYIGDCIMYLFGAPVAQPDHAERCVRAAIEMHRSLERFNRDAGLGFDLKLRTAINSGTVIAGDIGSPKRKDYSVLGDTVNIASRLESSVAKPGQIVIGEGTYARVEDKFRLEDLGSYELRGKKLRMQAYEVLWLSDLPGNLRG